MMEISYLSDLSTEKLDNAVSLLKSCECHPIACVNWGGTFPYRPEVHFHAAHNSRVLFLLFDVREDRTAALVTEDNAQVCNDSCVEFFLSIDDTGYYNFEFSCIGTLMLGFRRERPHAVYAEASVLRSIRRYPSLGRECFAERTVAEGWRLLAAIPATALFRHRLEGWQGLSVRANWYKCGDRLTTRHYLTHSPVPTAKPDFHRPEHFIPVHFATFPAREATASR